MLIPVDSLRRRGHAACGRCRASCTRSSCCRSSASARCCRRPLLRLARPRRTWRRRSSSATKRIASWSPSSCAQIGVRARGDRARARRPQHRAGRRARGARRRSKAGAAGRRSRRSRAAGAAGRSRHPRCARRFTPRSRECGRGGRSGQARDVRRRAARARDGLRLHPARRAARARRMPVAQFVEKPDAATARDSSSPPASTTGTAACSCSGRARYLEELRAPCAGHPRGLRGGVRGREERPRLHARDEGGVRRLPRAIRSTTR